MTYHKWTTAEERRLSHFYPDIHTRVLAEAMRLDYVCIKNKSVKMGLNKSRRFMESQSSGRIHKGNRPWNQGKKGWCPKGAEKSHFRPGHRPENWRPIGTERVNKDGIRERKVADTRIKAQDWRGVHVLYWERYRGPVPDGYFLRFKNGDKTDIRIGNLELVDRADNMRKNSLWNRYPAEVARLIQLRGALNRQINERVEP